MIEKIGILHPGQMGISVAASAVSSGSEVFWTSEGRSIETRKRAECLNLTELPTLAELCQVCSIIISVCPPHAAEDLSMEVVDNGFEGIYVDANAISPDKSKRLEGKMVPHEIDFVDGGIIGGPAWEKGKTWLYLSGMSAGRVAECFSAGLLETEVIGEEVGKASGIKMCFAAYTKGSSALLCAIMAAAESIGVRSDLERQWSRGGSDFASKTGDRVRRVTAKAWRFAGEMNEIADTLEGTGVPGGFHRAANEIYQRIAHFKGLDEYPSLENVLDSLLAEPKTHQ